MHDKPPAELCGEESKLWNYGVYRVVKCSAKPNSKLCKNGEKEYEEFISYCSPVIANHLSMDKSDYKKHTDELVK